MAYPNVTATKTHPDGRVTIKYTLSYELNVNVELFEALKCTGCPAYVMSYSNKCAITRTDIDGDDRPENCPLKKVQERI